MEEEIFLIQCANHGKIPWFAVCVHVMQGKPIFHLVECSDKQVGEALCEECFSKPAEIENLRAICCKCFNTHIRSGNEMVN